MKDRAHRVVCSAFANYLDVHPSYVQPHHHLLRDWGVDATEVGFIVRYIDDVAGIELDEPIELTNVDTVGDLAQSIRQRMRRAARQANDISRP